MFNQNPANSCGCQGCMPAVPTYQQQNQVVQTCNVQDVPHYTNFHTHVVNNCIKRHIAIPTYSTSAENVYLDEYVDAQAMYQQPMYNPVPLQANPMGYGCQAPGMNAYNPQMMQQPMQYQGNVGVDGLPQQMNPFTPNPYQNMGNIMNPFNN